jgi:hypothetical protein
VKNMIEKSLNILQNVEKKQKINNTILHIDKALLILKKLEKTPYKSKTGVPPKISLKDLEDARKKTDEVLLELDKL